MILISLQVFLFVEKRFVIGSIGFVFFFVVLSDGSCVEVFVVDQTVVISFWFFLGTLSVHWNFA